MKELLSEIEIDASAATVWNILTDVDGFSTWNPFIDDGENMGDGNVEEGSRLRLHISPPGGTGMTFRPKVTRVKPQRELRWLGRLGLPGVFDGEHVFEIVPIDDEHVRLVQREEFRGLMVPLLWGRVGEPTRRGFEAMNIALKERAERAERPAMRSK